jgi:hypothetical protein
MIAFDSTAPAIDGTCPGPHGVSIASRDIGVPAGAGYSWTVTEGYLLVGWTDTVIDSLVAGS